MILPVCDRVVLMADRKKIVPGNVAGDFFVDTTCINCDNCRQIAPAIFGTFDDYAGVKRQPETGAEVRQALQALICCPTGSIGFTEKHDVKSAIYDFPLPVADDVYYCGFNSAKSAGGKSYCIIRQDGNILTDAPKFHARLVQFFKEKGGLKYIFLTHRDDVADAHRYATEFGALRIIHREDEEAQPGAEMILEGNDVVRLTDDLTVIPTPGHTEGHCMLHYKDKFLFSGDVFTSSYRGREGLQVWSPDWCWYSYVEQMHSLERLLDYRFEWVLPGHGRIFNQEAQLMQDEVRRAIEWCKEEDAEPETPERLATLDYYWQEMQNANQPHYAQKQKARADALRHKLAATLS